MKKFDLMVLFMLAIAIPPQNQSSVSNASNAAISANIDSRDSRCRPKCHSLAICTRQNTCTCQPTYIGDGINRCVHPPPIVADFHPEQNAKTTHFSFTISPVHAWNPTEIFCRFGPTILKGSLTNGTAVLCERPLMKGGIHPCGLSFDGNEWSTPPFLIEFISDRLALHCFVGGFLAVLIALIATTLQWMSTKCGRRATERGYEEVMPLNKWHIHQAQPEGTDENTIVDFLLHMLLN
jgi:hypothetical protein